MKKPISTILKSDQYSRKIEIGNKERRRDWEERNRDQTDLYLLNLMKKQTEFGIDLLKLTILKREN
jgi:hypothetical protein